MTSSTFSIARRIMLQMVRDLGFRIENNAEDPDLVYVRIELPLPRKVPA